MSVLLRPIGQVPPASEWDWWCVVGDAEIALDPNRAVPGLEDRLEAVFDNLREEWWELGRRIGRTLTGEWSHTATAGVFTSDFGLMLAWLRLIGELGQRRDRVLVLCDDPWLFRAARGLDGVRDAKVPPLLPTRLRLGLRGIAARLALAVRLLKVHRRVRHQAVDERSTNAPWLLVYGHPASDRNGRDAYFGSLMADIPELRRLLHTDCRNQLVTELSADGRTVSLHAWGNPVALLRLPFTRWHLDRALRGSNVGWLLRRAEAMEGSGASAAATWWQNHCQRRWLARTRPRLVAWPWENHPWERLFVPVARAQGCRLIGYQHATAGRHMWNQGPASCPEGVAVLPDRLVCTGSYYADSMRERGIPPERIVIGGAMRFRDTGPLHYDPDGPIFVPLGHMPAFNRQLLAAIRLAAGVGYRFVLKDHPLVPFAFDESEGVRRTTVPLHQQPGLAGVLFTHGTVGLEAIMGGLPTYRLRLRGLIAYDVLPACASPSAVNAADVVKALSHPVPPPAIERTAIFAPIDMALWRREIGCEP